MKAPISWLNEYVDLKGLKTTEIAEKLVSIGFEVEEVLNLANGLKKVKTGKILSLEQIVGTKLRLCTVDAGEKLTLVSGASNLFVGMIAPVALCGAVLHDKTISKTEFKGVMSEGMLCSLEELGLDKNYIDFDPCEGGVLSLPKSMKMGEDIASALGLDEDVLDVTITANRPDCQCIYGLARELSAAFNKKLKPLNTTYDTAEEPANSIGKIQIPGVTIADENLCSRYLGSLISDIKIAKSPLFLRRRLLLCRVRPINNIVDVTNYVLLEVGQPLHAFDAGKIEREIIVRRAKSGEKLNALDGNTYALGEDNLVIADAKKPLAIAGIMGGDESAISDSTAVAFLESARFARGNIRSSSKKLALRSDSSAMYERGTDYDRATVGRDRALHLIQKLSAGKVVNASVEAGAKRAKEKVIDTKFSAIKALLGIKIPDKFVLQTLNNLSFSAQKSGDRLSVTVPLFREDVDNFTDLAEEAIRFYGYDMLNETMLKSAGVTVGGLPASYKKITEIENLCCGLGAFEVKSFSFINPACYEKLLLSKDDSLRRAVKILNPLSEDYLMMRTELLSSMLSCASTNLKRQNKSFRLFEIDKVFLPTEGYFAHLNDSSADSRSESLNGLVAEKPHLCLAFAGSGEDFYTIKGSVDALFDYYKIPVQCSASALPFLHPGLSADIFVGGEKVGFYGKLHPSCAQNFEIDSDVYVAEIDLEKIIGHQNRILFTPLPKFPAVERDVAIVINADVTVAEIIKTVKSCSELIRSAEVFDVYKGSQIEPDKKSVALKIIIQNTSKTLTDNEIVFVMDGIYKRLNALGGILR